MSGFEPGEDLVFGELPPRAAGLLRQLPQLGAIDSQAARRRMFPPPADPAHGEQMFIEDWVELVQPDLRRMFEDSMRVVGRDIAAMVDTPAGALLKIPRQNFDAWINALNQARLAIGAAHNLDEADLAGELPAAAGPARAAAVWRVHFFGTLQQILIDAMEGA